MLERLTERVCAFVEGRSPLGFTLAFDLGDSGYIHVAGDKDPMLVSNERQAAATTFMVAPDDLNRLFDGQLKAMPAFMSGRLRVTGDMGNALKLSSFLGS